METSIFHGKGKSRCLNEVMHLFVIHSTFNLLWFKKIFKTIFSNKVDLFSSLGNEKLEESGCHSGAKYGEKWNKWYSMCHVWVAWLPRLKSSFSSLCRPLRSRTIWIKTLIFSLWGKQLLAHCSGDLRDKILSIRVHLSLLKI